MRIVVTGREGQVVRSLIERAATHDVEVVALGRPVLDLSSDAGAIASAITNVAPDVIVSAAAYTLVDRAESEPELAFAVNERGARAVAKAAASIAVPLIHLSTDYVFDGSKPEPYSEDDPPAPKSVYGASKLAGERAVQQEHRNVAILRTAWVYSPFGTNFVKTMLRLASNHDELGVVGDQNGNPTSALDIADGILRVAANLCRSTDVSRRGIFHMAASGDASWAEFAEAIFACCRQAGAPVALVKHIASAEYPTRAERPQNSRLYSAKLERTHGVRLPDWRSSLPNVVSRLISSNDRGV